MTKLTDAIDKIKKPQWPDKITEKHELPVDNVVMPPEGCLLVAHNTGDGWILSVETQANETVAILKWPYGDKRKYTLELIEYGFKVV